MPAHDPSPSVRPEGTTDGGAEIVISAAATERIELVSRGPASESGESAGQGWGVGHIDSMYPAEPNKPASIGVEVFMMSKVLCLFCLKCFEMNHSVLVRDLVRQTNIFVSVTTCSWSRKNIGHDKGAEEIGNWEF